MQIDLSKKTAIVTGVASGVGLAIALQYLRSGVRGLIGVDVSSELPPELGEARKAYPDRCVFRARGCYEKNKPQSISFGLH